jgi:two-component system, OmpR family, response regulator RegX3
MPTAEQKTRVLLVEDEESYREAISLGLRREGYEVETAADGAAGLTLFAKRPPDIVLLDMLLPGMHGTEVCRRMNRIAPVPIVMVSAVDSELDVVLGLELGAAGYVTKPFHLRELVARMQAILRRVSPHSELGPTGPTPTLANGHGTHTNGHGANGHQPAGDHPSQVTLGTATIDFVRREVALDGERVHLSRREYDLLAVLLSPSRQVRTRDELIDLLWPDRYLSDSRTLDTHIHRLRTKLEPDPTSPRYIVTVRGVGFRIDPDGTRPPPPARV